MADITACVATKKECNKINCKRRHLKLNTFSQSYANFSLDFIDSKGDCAAYLSYSKKHKNKVLKIN